MHHRKPTRRASLQIHGDLADRSAVLDRRAMAAVSGGLLSRTRPTTLIAATPETTYQLPAKSTSEMTDFEIQVLMSQYNQSEQLASSVQKKMDDTSSSVIQSVG